MKYCTRYFDHADGRRAKICTGPTVYMVIREDHGQGKLVLHRKYSTYKGALDALRRRGGQWTMDKKRTD